jgi:hypothetical protein
MNLIKIINCILGGTFVALTAEIFTVAIFELLNVRN